jgi:hypothetical protein
MFNLNPWHGPIPVFIFCVVGYGLLLSIAVIAWLIKRGKYCGSSSDADNIPPPPSYEGATGLPWLPNYQEAIVQESTASTAPEIVVDPAELTEVIVIRQGIKRGKCNLSYNADDILPPSSYEGGNDLPPYQEAIVQESTASTAPEIVFNPAKLIEVIFLRDKETIIKYEWRRCGRD